MNTVIFNQDGVIYFHSAQLAQWPECSWCQKRVWYFII